MNTDNSVDSELRERILKARARLEFNPARMEVLPCRLMCIISELEEFEDASSTQHEHEELADVAIYLITMLHDLYEGEDWPARHIGLLPNPHESKSVLTRPIRRYVVKAMQYWRKVQSPLRKRDVCISMELALFETVRLARCMGFDLRGAIVEKLAILDKRSVRNGGKHPDS